MKKKRNNANKINAFVEYLDQQIIKYEEKKYNNGLIILRKIKRIYLYYLRDKALKHLDFLSQIITTILLSILLLIIIVLISVLLGGTQI